jgi:hypothetical protein
MQALKVHVLATRPSLECQISVVIKVSPKPRATHCTEYGSACQISSSEAHLTPIPDPAMKKKCVEIDHQQLAGNHGLQTQFTVPDTLTSPYNVAGVDKPILCSRAI